MRSIRQGLIVVLALGLLGAWLGAGTQAEGIPPITHLHGEAAGPPGELDLAWRTPLFDLPEPIRDLELAYDFRYGATYPTAATWDANGPIGGNLPAVGADFQGGVELKLIVGAKQSADQWVASGDTAWMRGQICILATPDPVQPVNRAVIGQPIEFWVTKDGTTIDGPATAWTQPPFGYASYFTGDLTDEEDGEWVKCHAKWGGGTLWVWQGLMIVPQSLEVSQDYWVVDDMWVPDDSLFPRAGGDIECLAGDLCITYNIPAGAVEEDTEVATSLCMSPPPPTGMPPAVPGCMCAFEVASPAIGAFESLVTCNVAYPPDMLNEYGGLGESSLRAYRWSDVRQGWELLENGPTLLNRDAHILTFSMRELGIFALAAETDADGDGLGDEEEGLYGTLAGESDSDGDNIDDGDELWITRGDPADPAKQYGEDQTGAGEGLPAEGYWVAARIVAGAETSPLSNRVWVGPPISIAYLDGPAAAGVFESDAAWGDLDGDEDPDLVLCGDHGGARLTRVYENTGSALDHLYDLDGVSGTGSGCLAWADYDGDGDLDLALAGQADAGPIARVYANDAGTLAWDGQALTGASHASVAWADYDRDGDLDLYVQGHDGAAATATLYANDGGGGLAPVASLHGLHSGSADWGDLDGDRDLDLIATGSDGTQRLAIVYINADGLLAEDGNHGLPDVALSDVALGDIDGDGDLDAALTGETGTAARHAGGWFNDGDGAFTAGTNLMGIYRSSCALGDLDLDGDLDAVFCGYTGTSLQAMIWQWDGTDFSPLSFYLPGVREGSLTLPDMDLDGDLDLFFTGADWGQQYAQLWEHQGITATGAPDLPPPGALRLVAAYPNPFNPGTTIRFELPATARATLRVFDARGRRVRTLLQGAPRPSGPQEVQWDGRDDAGRALPSGVYLCRIEAAGREAGLRMVLLK
ncbi:MAG: VCBS repeat-containing protein [Candidatus Krumholzibacteriota bacterium]|nr:VCBS repeat-containing protein [Candidatus Krumholzibacteriota bacterium]